METIELCYGRLSQGHSITKAKIEIIQLINTVMTTPQNCVPTRCERVAKTCVCCGNSSLKKSPAILMPFVAHRAFGWEPVTIDDSWGLKTIKNGTAYTVCNTNFCLDCGFLFLDMRFSDEEIALLYDGYRNTEYTELRESYEPGYKERNEGLILGINYIDQVEEFLAPFLSFPISILDWGGDTGENTPFKNANKIFHIYDISNVKPVHSAEIVTKEKALQTDYDLIVCSMVLEHVPYPAELILEIKQNMSKDTLLYIEVTFEELMRLSEEDKDLQLKKRHWHEHINFYSKKSLQRLLNVCGLQIVESQQLHASGGANTEYCLQIACRRFD